MNARAPTLLFLAFPFPPNCAIGAVRCANLAKHLSRLGWQITVVTVDPQLLVDPDPTIPDPESWCREVGVQRVLTGFDYRMFFSGSLVWRWWEKPVLVRRAANWFARRFGFDSRIGWIQPVLEACSKFRPGDFDVVLASGTPFAAFEAARQLGKRLGAKVVLDYRDLWSMAPHARRRTPARVVRAEKTMLEQAAGVFVVSAGMARCMENEFGHGNKISVITNGFDPDDFSGITPTPFAQPTIVYAGTFYPPLRVIHPVLDAICRVNRSGLTDGKVIRFLYLGANPGHVLAAAREMDAQRWVEVGGQVSRREVLAALKGSLAAAVITSVQDTASPQVDTILTGKLFEAMGAGAKILLVAPPGTEAAQVVTQSNAGNAFVGSDVVGMADWIRQLACGSDAGPGSNVHAYAWSEIAKQADSALRRVRIR